MWSGDFASDMHASAYRQRAMNAVQEHMDAAAESAAIANHNGELFEKMSEANAANLAHRWALHEQLRTIDPTNPLLTDKLLIERLQAAGTAAFRIASNDYDAASELGRTFNIPGREKKHPVPITYENLKLAYAGGLAQRHAMAAELRRLDSTNPLLTDAALIEQIRNAGGTAYIKAGEDMAAAIKVGDTFTVPRG